jgi:hypothetical protein
MPEEERLMSTEHYVWIVNRLDEVDGLYVFEGEHRARDFASRYADAVVSEEMVMNDSASAQFLIDTADDDADGEPYDHSMAKEDRRNAGLQAPARQRRAATDAAALDHIATILRDPEWGLGMLEDIADLVTETGRDVAGNGESTWDRH